MLLQIRHSTASAPRPRMSGTVARQQQGRSHSFTASAFGHDRQPASVLSQIWPVPPVS
jgi:hypothetical protein